MKNESVIRVKSFAFAVRTVRLAQYLHRNHQEYVLSKQVLRSGTAIGALVHESEYAQSRQDFISKLSIALKEAHETLYWLQLLVETDYLDQQQFSSLEPEIREIIAILVSSIKTSKSNV